MSLGTTIKKLRKGSGMTQEDLAKALGLKRVTIATFETGRANPSLDVVRNMARLFQVSVDALLNENGETAPSAVRGRPRHPEKPTPA